MRVYEFADAMRYDCLKDLVMIKRGGEYLRKCRVEDLPFRPNDNRHQRVRWVDEHIETVHMEAVHTPGTLPPTYRITLELSTEPYPVI